MFEIIMVGVQQIIKLVIDFMVVLFVLWLCFYTHGRIVLIIKEVSKQVILYNKSLQFCQQIAHFNQNQKELDLGRMNYIICAHSVAVMQFEFKNIDRCSSQQINQTQVNQSLTSHKSEKASDISTQLHQLLNKIQAMNSTRKQQDQPPPKRDTKFITKQGKTQDQPHRPSVLSVNKYKKSKQVSQKSSPVDSKHQQIKIASEKDQEVNSNNFYKYCTDEIVRVSTQNSNLQKNLHKTLESLQNEKKVSENLKKENLKLAKQVDEYKNKYENCNEQLSTLKYQLQQSQRQNLAKQKFELDSQSQKTKIYENQLSKYRKIIAQKDEQNSKLMNQIKSLKLQLIQNLETGQQNKRLGKKIAQLMASNKSWQDKARGKSQAVDYLWNIKQIQYGNIVQLIALAKKK